MASHLLDLPLHYLELIALEIDDLRSYLAFLSTCRAISAIDKSIHKAKREQFLIPAKLVWNDGQKASFGCDQDKTIYGYWEKIGYIRLASNIVVMHGLYERWNFTHWAKENEVEDRKYNPNEVCTFSLGMRHGHWAIYKTGCPGSIRNGTYVNDKKYGKFEEYRPDGESRVISVYNNDVLAFQYTEYT